SSTVPGRCPCRSRRPPTSQPDRTFSFAEFTYRVAPRTASVARRGTGRSCGSRLGYGSGAPGASEALAALGRTLAPGRGGDTKIAYAVFPSGRSGKARRALREIFGLCRWMSGGTNHPIPSFDWIPQPVPDGVEARHTEGRRDAGGHARSGRDRRTDLGRRSAGGAGRLAENGAAVPR